MQINTTSHCSYSIKKYLLKPCSITEDMNQSNDIMKVISEDIDVTFDVRGILSWINNPNRNVMICFEYNSDLRHAGNKNNNLQS